MMRIWIEECRGAVREILARPAFAALVVAVLTAGLATVLYVLSIINGLVIRPLPFQQPEQLHVAGVKVDDDLDSVSHRDLLDLALRLKGKAQVTGWSDGTINVVDGERAERFDGSFVEPALFPTLGVKPLLGTDFESADAVPAAALKVALSHEVWRTRFLADPKVLGRAIRVNGEDATIVAVMPERFSFPRRTQVWVPARSNGTLERADDYAMQVVVRWFEGKAGTQLQSLLNDWYREVLKSDQSLAQGAEPGFIGMRNYFTDEQTRAILGVMLMATLLVLLVACGNTANLMLARSLASSQELAVRSALGASRTRLVLHLFVYSLLLALIAAGLAALLAHGAVSWTMASFQSAGEEGPAQWMDFSIDGSLLLWILLAAVLTSIMSGLWPALRLSRGLIGSLREGGRGTIDAGFARIGSILVALEIALSAALLIAALVMVQEIRALDRFNFGVRTPGMLTARIGLFESQYPSPQARQELFQRMLERLGQESAVKAATISSFLPGLMGPNARVLPESAAITDEAPWIGYGAIDANFANAYQSKLIAGRWFDHGDRAESEAVAIVDEKFVAQYFPGQSALDQRFRLWPNQPESRVVRIVGVMESLTLEDADDDPEPVMLAPITQDTPSFVSLAVRLNGDPGAFKPRLTAIMHEIDPDTPLYWLRSYDEVMTVANFGQRLLSVIFASFGVIALVLAAGGLYGVIGFTVTQRTREIGVRRALGASASTVTSGLLRRNAVLAAIGLSIGLALGVPLALALTTTLRTTVGLDPRVWLVVALVLASVAILASLLPARRALRVDPMVALRHD
jgi:predicted permease